MIFLVLLFMVLLLCCKLNPRSVIDLTTTFTIPMDLGSVHHISLSSVLQRGAADVFLITLFFVVGRDLVFCVFCYLRCHVLTGLFQGLRAWLRLALNKKFWIPDKEV